MTVDSNNRESVLSTYTKKLREHREVEARLKEGLSVHWLYLRFNGFTNAFL